MTPRYIIARRSPTVEEYRALRASAGLERVTAPAALEGLSNSLFSVCVFHEGALAGLGRVVGDGGLYFYIQDVVVLPEHQGQGLEKLIIDCLMSYLKESASSDASICAMASEVSCGFCEHYGFAGSLNTGAEPSGGKAVLHGF